MTRDALLNDLIGRIYESVQDIEALKPAMRMLAHEINCVGSQYVHLNTEKGSVVRSFSGEAHHSAENIRYAEHYNQIDPRLHWFVSGKLGAWRADYERFDDSFVSKNEFYNDFLFKFDVRHMIVAKIGGEVGKPETLAMARQIDAEPFNRDDLSVLNHLSPHIIRATRLRAEFEAIKNQEAIRRSESSVLPYGTVWVDASLRITLMNDVAADILALADGIKVREGRLYVGNAGKMNELAEALLLATSPIHAQGRWLAVRRSILSAPLIVSIIPMKTGSVSEPAALIILHDPTRHVFTHVEQMKMLFGLTAAEARLTQALVDNETLENFADRCGLTSNTVRSQLKSVFAKTGTSRQAELIRMMLLTFPSSLA